MSRDGKPLSPRGASRAGRLAPALAILLVCLLSHSGLTPVGAATSPDSIRYLEAAHNFRAGRGLFAPGPGVSSEEVPFTGGAPLYPLALSVFLGEGDDRPRAAANLGLLALSASALLFFLLLRPATGRTTATVGAVVFVLAQPSQTVFTYAWTESLMIPLLLASTWAWMRCVEPAGQSARRELVRVSSLTLGLVLVVYCRYAGCLFAPLLPWAWLVSRDKRRRLPWFAGAAAVYLLSLGWLALRNFRLTGQLSGAAREPSGKGLVENVGSFLSAMSLPISTEPFALILGGLLVGTLVVLRRRRPRTRDGREGEGGYTRRLAGVCLVAVATYSIGLVLLRTFFGLDPLDIRFLSPAFVFLLLLAFLGIVGGWSGLGRPFLSVPALATCGGIVALVAVQGIATYRSATAGWTRYGSPRFPLSREQVYVNYTIVPSTERNRAAYEAKRSLAERFAGVADVERSVLYTRECLQLNRGQAEVDMLAIAAPFWEREEWHDEGLRYYQDLLQDLPDAWWMHHNIAELARRLGLADLSTEEFRRAQELKGRAPPEEEK